MRRALDVEIIVVEACMLSKLGITMRRLFLIDAGVAVLWMLLRIVSA